MKFNSSRTAIILFILMVTIPYLLAQASGGKDFVFGGFLLNPEDGNTYLAKMNEGWSGSWQFTLPFTSEKGQGAFVYLFYLFLGHLSRFFGASLVITYHIARLCGAFFLAICLTEFIEWFFDHRDPEIREGLWLGLFGSGIGWLFVFLGIITSDLWVAEAFPFLAGLTSPHFSFGMGLSLLILMKIVQPSGPRQWVVLAVLGLLLSLLMPFGIVVTGMVSVVWAGWEWQSARKLHWQPLLAAFFLGGIYLIYQYWTITNDPLLSGWSQQNLTRSPPVWDLMLSLFPAILLAAWAVWRIFHNGEINSKQRLLITWFAAGLIMIYIPFTLQRRFMFAIFIPISILAVVGLGELPAFARRWQKMAFPVLLGTSIITNLVVILIAGFGILSHSPLIYLSRDESDAFAFLRSTAQTSSIVLCAPDTGVYIPGRTGLRVIYGHPFETVHATQMKELVEQLYSSNISQPSAAKILDEQKVNYIFWGPREKQLGTPVYIQNLKPVYQNETVQIFSW